MKNLRTLVIVFLMLTMLAVAPVRVQADQFPSYTSGFQVQNLEATDARITLYFYNADGTIRQVVGTGGAGDPEIVIAGGKSKTYVNLPLSSADPFSGSLVVSSDKQVGIYVNVMDSLYKARGSYVGAGTGGTTVKLPMLMKANGASSNWNTMFYVQNAGSGDATVTVTYADACGAQPAVTVKEGASRKFDQATEACHANGIFGASVASDKPIVVVVMQESPLRSAMSVWSGFNGTGNVDIKIPLVNIQADRGWSTGIQIFNTGGSSTDLTLTYLDAGGVTTCTERQTIPSNGTKTFALNAFTATSPAGITTNCNGKKVVGTAFIATPANNSAAMPLIAVVSQTKFTATTNFSGAYNAFSAADGTAKVVFPLIMDRNGARQWQTGFNVMNVGTAATYVKCTFDNTSYTKTGPATGLLPNQGINDVQGTKIAAAYIGSGSCVAYTNNTYTTVDATAKLVAVLNQTGVPYSASEKDLLLVDEGINVAP